ERTPYTARQAGLIYTHLRYHALVPAQIEIDAVRSYRVRIEPGLRGADRWSAVRARGHVRVATTSFGDGAAIEWTDRAAVGVSTADERARKLGQAIEDAARAGVDILVAPELTLPPAARDQVLAELRWASGPELALLVPGSFHERIADRTVNRALLADGKGNVLCEHHKLAMFGAHDGWLESIALGDEVRVVVTPIGTVAIAICKDFCDYFVGRIWEQLQAEWLLVPAYGRGASAHEEAAARVARMVGTVIVLAHEGDRATEVEPNSFVHGQTLAKGTRNAPEYFTHSIPLADEPGTS
ncbi:MAG TPA: nitrilase-related carbon-nitrogen hydrolase, partial [Kofleriaceae bacterium]|nr:nitrilase-related carbon-nitrogen hydrolase [Kofleriaceae bacterium]